MIRMDYIYRPLIITSCRDTSNMAVIMYFYSFCLIMSLWKISEAAFTFQCPVQSQWKHRAESQCSPVHSYFCLFDRYRNDQNFTEFCREDSDFEAPGQKLIIAGSFNGTLQGAPCENDLYQPFKFLSSGNSRCAYKKSSCNEEGQVIYGNGSQKTDSVCRCDYTKGYNFIIRPKHGCYCVPSDEDCSCYSKICPPTNILSQDYECLNENEWKASFECKPIDAVMLPGSSQIVSTVKPLFGQYKTGKFEKNKKKACFAGLVLTMFILLLSASICIPTSNLFSLRLIHRFTDTNIPAEKSATEGNIVKPQIKEFQDEILQEWGRKVKKIVSTNATEYIYQKIAKKNIIIIVGPAGSGKSAIAYYVAFKYNKNFGHTIIPVSQSEDISDYHVPGTKQIFIVDDFIGKYIVNETDVYSWEKHWSLLKMIFGNNDNTKLILTSRTDVWQPERYTYLSECAYTCDLLSDQIKLSLTERWDICKSYLKEVDIKALDDETILMYSFFPSVCSSYKSSENIAVNSFFSVPYQIIQNEINNFKIKSQVSFIALAILAIKQKVSKDSFSINNQDIDELLQDVFHESTILQYPSKNMLMSSLVGLTGTYVERKRDNFIFTHEILQNVVLRCIAKTLINSVIKYCKLEVISKQLRLNCFYAKHDDFTIEIMAENESTYFRRLIRELGEGCHEAIFRNEQNNIPEFRIKFLKNMKINLPRDYWTKKKESMPALHVVSALGYQDYVSFFIHDKTMINQKDSDGNIPLHLACKKGHVKIVQSLLENKSNIDIANNEGLKPLVYACENNAIAVAKFLLHHCGKSIKINEKFQKRNKGSVLHIVSSKGFVNIMLLLLENDADVDLQDGSGCTPLHLASKSAVAKTLLDYGAKINSVDAFGRSPVYSACSTNQEKVLELLIEKNAEINQKTKAGLRPLHAACQCGSIGIVNMLIEKEAKINSSEPGITPLHEACKNGNADIINTLIRANASVNHKTKDGLTPLHEACRHKHISAVQILLDNQANVNEADKHGWTALLFSCARGSRTILDLLIQYGANVNIGDEDRVTPLILACKEEYTDIVDSLLRSKANVNDCDRDNCSSMLVACKAGNVDLVSLLLKYSADINWTDKDNCSSLLVACKSGNVDLVSVLLRYSADINLADKDMITPLHAACMNNNNTNLVMKLVESNANVNAADKNGQTPLFKSIVHGYNDIVDILLRHGAFIDICDASGLSPVAIANIEGNKTVSDALSQHSPINKIV